MLKLKMCFVENKYLDEVVKEKKASVRKQTIKDYVLVKVLGEGAFAKVLQVRNKANGRIFAMKVIHKSKIMNFDEKGLTTEELTIRNMYRVKQIISERNIFSNLN